MVQRFVHVLETADLVADWGDAAVRRFWAPREPLANHNAAAREPAEVVDLQLWAKARHKKLR